MKNTINTILLSGILLLTGCEETLLDPEYENNAINNFECLWDNYDRYYGEFLVRNLNWDSLYTVYRPMVTLTTSDQELHDLFRRLIYHFHDDHVFIDPSVPGLYRIESGRSDTMKVQTDFSAEMVDTHYLQSVQQYSEHIWFGMFPDNIGYIRMNVFADPLDYIGKAFDNILGQLKNTDGIIFDIRRLEGGDDRVARNIAGRFAKEKKLYMTSRKRNGANHDDFETTVNWFVNPEGNSQYVKPVMLLTGRFTASAGETFTWAMNENSNVTQVGDTTLGAFSDIMTKELPNGWSHTIPVGDYRNSAGRNLEGIGIAPDIYVKSTKQETIAGIDRALETALALLKQNSTMQ
jgi:C-terminal processing protease CtpA/Prc